MYLEFYKFKKNPFHITPDPDFLFLSPSHKEASASIFYGIETRKGFVAVTGEVGVGKTTILRSYLEGTDPEKIRIVYIFNAALSFDKLLKQIFSELGIRTASQDPAELVDLLLHYLIDEYSKDRNVVLIIDEAQNMPIETLERLRMLSNLETSQDKLIQLILVGQPEFEAKLKLPELRQLKQRIAIRSRISALTVDESIAYIHHRLMKASSFHNPVFTKKALKRIAKEANGVPRTINILCDNALVTAYGYRQKPVDEKIVKEVIRDFNEEQPRSGIGWKIVWFPAVVACFAVAFLISPRLMSKRGDHTPRNQSIEARVGAPPPETVKQRKPKSVPAYEKAPEKKKEPAPAGEDINVETTAQPDAKPAIESAKPPVRGRPEGTKNEAPATVHPVELGGGVGASVPPAAAAQPAQPHLSKDKPGPAPPTVPAVPGKNAPSEDASKIAPAPVPSPVQPSATLSKPKSGNPVVVRQGDTVSKLLIAIYGRADTAMLDSFKELNPQIKDINRISVGQKIILP